MGLLVTYGIYYRFTVHRWFFTYSLPPGALFGARCASLCRRNDIDGALETVLEGGKEGWRGN